MSQLQRIGAVEKRLWESADTLRANSSFAADKYLLPIMGLIFLRHAYSRYLRAKAEVEPTLPSRGGVRRALTRDDFGGRGALYLREVSQFDTLAALPDSASRAVAIRDAMEAIEEDYPALKGQLPKAEYAELDNDVLGRLLRIFDDEALHSVDGDLFGRIYEYFLTGFADLKAHDGGEFFTPVSLVEMIVNVIEPDHGKVLDPACGSGGMFVQSAHFIEQQKASPMSRVTFYGMEKEPTTIRLAKMNLAVHGLEGQIASTISYYDDPHELDGRADFVMANPPFNVDEIDPQKAKAAGRLPFGLPLSKQGKVSNGNYVWISYFYSYLNATGRAGFVMSSQASSAGGTERDVRQKLVETGAVDAMMSIRGGFFYTRTVPCELWFLDRAKPADRRDKVLMIDARNVYRKVTRVIYEFSPEQLANLTSIVWLYRGQTDRFLGLVARHLSAAREASVGAAEPLERLATARATFERLLNPVLDMEVEHEGTTALLRTLPALADALSDYEAATAAFDRDATMAQATDRAPEVPLGADNAALHALAGAFAPLADDAHTLARDAEHVRKLAGKLIEGVNALDDPYARLRGRDVKAALRDLEETARDAAEALRQVRYFHRSAHWLQERFPDAVLVDVAGLVKVVDHDELARNDWSLTPGRYVGVAPEAIDEDFDFEGAMTAIHDELQTLNAQAAELADRIAANFEEVLG